MQATLAKWGNSQGIRLPRTVCDELDLEIGEMGTMTVDIAGRAVTITFEELRPKPRYRRRSHASLEELSAGWTGGKVGEEWGGEDVGAEEVV